MIPQMRFIKILSVFFFIFYTSLCLAQVDLAQIDALSQNAKLIEPQLVLEDFMQGLETTRVIVNLSKPVAFQQNGDINDLGFRKSLQETVQSAQDGVISRLDPRRVSITNRFVYIFGFSAEVTLEGLRDLTKIPEVISINNDRILEPHLAQGIPLINASTVRQGYNGAGMAIAICDTGINYTHPYLGNGGFPNSKVLGGYDTGQNDADPMDANGHGTACAGIAAGDLPTSPVDDYIGGVAYNAKLYALKMTNSSTGASAYTSDMVEAWEWAVTHQNDNPSYPIMIISTSFGGGYYTSNCNGAVPAMTTAAQNAVNAGITLFVSSGNSGYCDATGWPACITHVNSVGAVYDANIGQQPPGSGSYWCIGADSCNKTSVPGCSSRWGCFDASTNSDLVACYSNTASFLNLLAPSNNANTLGLGTSYNTTFGGTSAACPYAAGAAAVLQSVAKANKGSYLTPAQVKSRLASTGNLVTDIKQGGLNPGIPTPRINLGNAANSFGDDLAGLTSGGNIFYTTDLQTWTQIPGALNKLVIGDFDEDGKSDDLAGITSIGTIYYTTDLQTWTQIPGALNQLVVGDFDGNGSADLAGLTSVGTIYYTTDLQTWTQIPGALAQLVSGNFNSTRIGDELAGLASDGSIWVTTDLLTWVNIPGLLNELVVGDFNGDDNDDLAGLASNGSIYFTTNLSSWANIPGALAQLVSGNFNSTRVGDELAGLASDGSIWLSTDLSNWTNIPGALAQLVSGNFNSTRVGDELAGLASNGSIWFTTDLSTWTNIPGDLSELAE